MEKIIKYIADNYEFFKDIAYKITNQKDIAQDLLNSCIIYINDKYNKASMLEAFEEGYFKFMFIRIIKQEYLSNNSYFHREDTRFNKINSTLVFDNRIDTDEVNMDDKIYCELIKETIIDVLKTLTNNKVLEWWECEVYLRYNFRDEKISFRKLMKETLICESTLWTANNKVDKIVKRIMKDKIKGI